MASHPTSVWDEAGHRGGSYDRKEPVPDKSPPVAFPLGVASGLALGETSTFACLVFSGTKGNGRVRQLAGCLVHLEPNVGSGVSFDLEASVRI